MKYFLFSTEKNWWIYVTLGLFVSTLFSCNSGSELESTIESELETGIRNDSLFLGLNFGISREQFYDQCWKLNKQGLVKQGPENMSVKYLFRNSEDLQMVQNFYADFDEDQAHLYNTSFYYYGWAPWNKNLQSDQLLEDLTEMFLEWYGGNEAFSMMVDGRKHYYKVDGNRLIHFFIMDERLVAAKYYDLSNPKNQNLFNESD